MKLAKILAIVMALVLCVGCLAGCGGYTAKNEKIKIGFSGPLTGPAAVYGVAVQNSAQMAVDEINAAGGLDGIEFELVAMDDKHDAANVATNYAELFEGGMQISLGTVTTAPGLEFSKLSAEDNVFFLTPSASGDKIPEFDNGFQMCFADGNQGKVAAEFVNGLGKDKIGIFYKSDDPYSKGIYDQFKANLDASITVVETSFTDANATDFSTQIDTLKNCGFIFMPIYYTPASQFMTQANEVENNISVYYGCDGFDGIDAIEGFDISTVKQEVSYLSHFTSTAPEGPAAEFIAKYNDKYDEEKEPLNQFGAAAYDCVYAIYEALKVAVANGKEVDADTSASDMCEILKEVFNSDSFTFRGITGKTEGNEKSTISWSADGTVQKEASKYLVKEASN